MAFINIQIDTGLGSIGDINAKGVTDSSKPQEGVVLLRNLLDGILAGTTDAVVSVVTDTAVLTISVPVSPDTESATYNLK